MDDLRNGCGFLSPAELDAWLDGTLPEERRAEFERHADGCSACAELAADLDVFRGVAESGFLPSEAREAEGHESMLRARLRREISTREAGATRRRVFPVWGWALAVAASVVVAVLLFSVPGRDKTPSILLADGGRYAVDPKSFMVPPVVRGGRDLSALWQDARRDYEARRWRSASGRLEEIEKEEPGQFDAVVYRGVCLLMMDRPSEARAAFARAREIAADGGLPTEAVAYYEGLAYLVEGNAAEGRRLLGEASAGGGEWGSRAAALLRSLPKGP